MLVIERTMELVRLVRIIWIKLSYHGNNPDRFVTSLYTDTPTLREASKNISFRNI